MCPILKLRAGEHLGTALDSSLGHREDFPKVLEDYQEVSQMIDNSGGHRRSQDREQCSNINAEMHEGDARAWQAL